MADKKDMATLLDRLERLCLEMEAYRYLYRASDTRWATRLGDYRKANTVRLRKQFDEVRAALQRTPHSDPIYEPLIDFLEKVLTA